MQTKVNNTKLNTSTMKYITKYYQEKPFYSTHYFQCYEVDICDTLSHQKDVCKRQMFIVIPCKTLSQDTFQSIQKGIQLYQQISSQSKVCSPLVYISFNRQARIIEIVTPMPLYNKLDDYFNEKIVSNEEFRLHVTSAFSLSSIISLFKMSPSTAIDLECTISFINTTNSVFPQLRLTPLIIFHQLFNTIISQQYNENHQIPQINQLKNIILGNSSFQSQLQEYQSFSIDNCLEQFNLDRIGKKEIGSGAFSKVYEIQTENGLDVVVKKSINNKVNNLIKEYQILSLCNHPNIVKTYGMKIEYKPSSIGYLFLEKCDMNLYDYLESMKKSNQWITEEQITDICKQMISSIHYIYTEFGIIHRDIKLSNFLIKKKDNGIRIKLCDFGLATKEYHQMNEQVGTAKFASPEILGECSYTNKSDIFIRIMLLLFIDRKIIELWN